MTPQSGNNAAGDIYIDAVCAINNPAERAGSVLVARSVISEVVAETTSAMDVEYALGVAL